LPSIARVQIDRHAGTFLWQRLDRRNLPTHTTRSARLDTPASDRFCADPAKRRNLAPVGSPGQDPSVGL